MSKAMHQRGLSIFCLIAASLFTQIGFAEDAPTFTATPISQTTDDQDSAQTLVKYLYNLGGELGYDLKNAVSSPSSTFLVTPPEILQGIAATALITLFGSIPVNASKQDPSLLNFVPTNNPTYSGFNSLANTTFQSYNSPSGTGTTAAGANATTSPVTVSPLVDQKTYQSDPVSQTLLNMLGTPNSSYCMDRTGTTWLNNNSQTLGDCAYLYDNKVLSNVIGTLPTTPFLLPDDPNPVLNELNSNTLVAPLLYTTTSNNSATPPAKGNQGLTATNQVQQATNFIRYATGSVLPMPTPTQVNYNSLLNTIYSSTSGRTAQESARAILDKYFVNARVFAAKSSVAISNLYFILSKRLPQTQSQTESSGNGTSQALSEMSMATRRLYDPAAMAAGKPQWLTQINTASPATVQKEMAILLSEINYQLYLNRQQEERLLLTNSLLLIQSLKQDTPDVPSPESLAQAAANSSE